MRSRSGESGAARLRQAFRPDSALWRRAFAAGVEHGPDAFVRYSPPLFGVAFAAGLPVARGIVRSNLRRVLGRRPAAAELYDVAAVFSNYACCLTEALLVGSKREGYALRSTARGVAGYYEAAAEGRGVIIATAHTAGWEIAGPVLAGIHPAEVVIVMQRERDEQARAIQDEARVRAGVKVVHTGESAFDALALLGRLRRGAVVAMQIDRVPPGMRARVTSLFGDPWHVPEGPLALAAASGAPILPVFTRRIGFMEYEALVAPAIRLPRRASASQLDGAARQLTAAMETFIHDNPTQWFHFV
jgi:phosphatidylinositol dimannoside acyltransferase